MSDVSSLLLAVLLPLVCMWAGATTLVTVAMLRLTAGRDEAGGRGLPRFSAEMWGAIAASGAAAGGVLALSLVAPALPLGVAAGALARLLTATAFGMLVGAGGTAGLVLLATWLWGGEA